MQAEAANDRRDGAMDALEDLLHRIRELAETIFKLLLRAQQDVAEGAKPIDDAIQARPKREENRTALAVRNLGEMLAAMLGGGSDDAAPAPQSAVGRRYAAVAEQMAASLQAYGLPIDGAELPQLAPPARMRAWLIESLQRNFPSRAEDGTRVYYKMPPRAGGAAADTRRLRGAALVNADRLRAEADSVQAIVDRLPDMLRFSPRKTEAVSESRGRLRGLLDKIVAAASDPTGPKAERGRSPYQRLSATLFDMLAHGKEDAVAPQGSQPESGDAAFWARLAAGSVAADFGTRASTTAVQKQRGAAELAQLGRLMVSIHGRLTSTRELASRDAAANRLEELLTAAAAAATALESELGRLGTSPIEHEVQFLAGGAADISLAQFIGWTHAACAPFAGMDDAAADLLPDEALILSSELDALQAYADAIPHKASQPPENVRQRLEELAGVFDLAAVQARTLAVVMDGRR